MELNDLIAEYINLHDKLTEPIDFNAINTSFSLHSMYGHSKKDVELKLLNKGRLDVQFYNFPYYGPIPFKNYYSVSIILKNNLVYQILDNMYNRVLRKKSIT